MTPRQTIKKWLDAFNNADVDTLESLYADNAINHQMPNQPIIGKEAIGQMFRDEFALAPEMNCIIVQIVEENEWAVLERRDPKGFTGCGFFRVIDGKIQTQRGYWDKLTFNKLYDLAS